jgi:SAM-dependent methyltransferase
MTRAEIEKAIEPVIRECLRRFSDYAVPELSAEEFGKITVAELRADVRRVSLLIVLAQSAAGSSFGGEGLELGCGYGYLLFPLAMLQPEIRWTAVEHPKRKHFSQPAFQQAIRDHNCTLVGADFVREGLPFADGTYSMVAFSETLEHLPVERVNFVLGEISRVLRPGGLVVMSSPNQASLENRIRLLKGKSILELPNLLTVAAGTFGHIRLYTPEEITEMMTERGFTLERSAIESNNSSFRGSSGRSLLRRLYRLYEVVEQRVGMLRSLGDTWYMVFRKNSAAAKLQEKTLKLRF